MASRFGVGASRRAEIQIKNLLMSASLALLTNVGASAETLRGRVVGVADGDTITVLDADHHQHKIRLSGIDAREKAQPFGQRSKESMSTWVFGKDVEVRWNKRDRYQRIIAAAAFTTSPAAHALQRQHETHPVVDIADGDRAAHLGHVGLSNEKSLASVAVGAPLERRMGVGL